MASHVEQLQKRGFTLSPLLGIGFASGSIAISFLSMASVYVLVFLSTELGIAASTAGLYLALTKVYDAATDPLMGVISDRTKSRWGRRRPYLLLGAFLGGLAFVALFNIPRAVEGALLHVYVIGALLLSATAYTVFRVPQWAMSSEIVNGYAERTHLMAYASVFGLVGAATGGAAIPYMLEFFKDAADSRLAYEQMALVMGLAVFIAALVCFYVTGLFSPGVQTPPSRVSIFKQFRSAFSTRPFVVLVISHAIFLLASATLNGSALFFIDYVLEVPRSYLGNVFAIQIGAMVISQPFWVRAVAKYGKRNCYVVGVLLFCVGNMSWLMATATEPMAWMALRVTLIGVGSAAVSLCAFAMLPDTMEYDQLSNGIPRQGLLAGVYTTLEKLSLAVGVALLGFLLDLTGFQESTTGIVAQTDQAVFGVQLCFVILPTVFALLSMVVLFKYDLSEAEIDAARQD